MDLHIGYESVEPYKLKRIDITDEKARKAGVAPKAMLKAEKETGRLVLDSETTLTGVPAAAWEYKLGNRCALEWILDQYKEKYAEGPDHPREVQHLSLRGLQGRGDRPLAAGYDGERRDTGDRRGDASPTETVTRWRMRALPRR